MVNEAVIAPGDVILVRLLSHVPGGREQEGVRPAVVISVPPEPVRYPLVIAVPLTSQSGLWAQRHPEIYPSLAAGEAGLSRRSVVLLDQIRGVDARRVVGYLGSLDEHDLERIRAGLRLILQL